MYTNTTLASYSHLNKDIPQEQQHPDLLGQSSAIQSLREQIYLYASLPFPVLIEGESGSGKEIVAHAIRKASKCPEHCFQAINCGALAPSLIESTLFGHRKGAFTGATDNQIGFFEACSDGLLFLDEIAELPMHLQSKLLRVLENGEFQRLGEHQTRRSHARIIAATNRNLRQAIKANEFRADLFHRLNVLSIKTPALRKLGADKLLLLEHFRLLAAQQAKQPAFKLSSEAQQYWEQYSFPGNVRELRSLTIRLTAQYPGKIISREQLQAEFEPLDLSHIAHDSNFFDNIKQQLQQGNFDIDKKLHEQEGFYLTAAMGLAAGNISKAAKMLGIKRTTLHSRLNKHNELDLL